ncbi:hypothetical protein WDW89_00375 [Deltaproteobacteria bacterium TL4]
MAIYGVGAFHETDVSDDFILNNIVGVGWSSTDAPELQNYFKSLKVGDIVYIKASAFGSADITIKAIGIIRDSIIRTDSDTGNLISTGRNVVWLCRDRFVIPKPQEKNNVRSNTIYEEFHPEVQTEILRKITPSSIT